jgi:hypothetical protein
MAAESGKDVSKSNRPSTTATLLTIYWTYYGVPRVVQSGTNTLKRVAKALAPTPYQAWREEKTETATADNITFCLR